MATLLMVLIGIPVMQYQNAATEFPTKPVRLVVTHEAGAAAALVARDIGKLLERKLGRPVIVENRAAAGIEQGARHVASSRADGHTILLGSRRSHVELPAKDPHRAGYDPLRDFTPLVAFAVDESGEWLGILAPAGIPGDNEATLVTALLGVLRAPDMHASLARHELQPLSLVSSEFRDFLRRDLADREGNLRMAALGGSR